MSANKNKPELKKQDPFITKNPLLFKKYKPIKIIGKGTFSTVYLSININTGQQLAIKVEKRECPATDLLESEAFLLYLLRGFGIPEVISFGRTKTHNILIEPLLGFSLLDLHVKKKKKILMKDICMIAIQLIDRIEWVHSKNVVYRDIKPENFLFGKKDPETLYIIDFGLCRKYKSTKTGKHIIPKNTGKFTGTSRYASVYAMAGNEQSRRDDIESIGYLLIFLMKGRLPWQGINGKSHKECYQKLYLMKKYMPVEKLCNGLPKGMSDFLIYAKNLKFEQQPDYNYLKSLFKVILSYLVPNISLYKFSWLMGNNLNPMRKSSPQNRLYRKIQRSLEHKKSTSPMSQQAGVSLNFVKNIKNINVFDSNDNMTMEKNYNNNNYYTNSNQNYNNLNVVNNLQKSNNNNTLNLNNNFNAYNNKEMSRTLPVNYHQTINSYNTTETNRSRNMINSKSKIPFYGDRIITSPGKNSKNIPSNNVRDNLIDNILIRRKPILSNDLERKKDLLAKKIIIENKNTIKQSQNSNIKRTNYIPINKNININYNNSYRNLLYGNKNLNSINLNQFKTENHIRNNVSADSKNYKNFIVNNVNYNNTISGNINTMYKKENNNDIYTYKKNSNIINFDDKELIKRNTNNMNRIPNRKTNNSIVNSNSVKINNNIKYNIMRPLSKENSKIKLINGKKRIIKNTTGNFFNNTNYDGNIPTNSPVFYYDKNRKLKNQNSMVYTSDILTNNRNNINNLNINNPTINININNKNENISPVKEKRISNIKRFNIPNSKENNNNNKQLINIKITESPKKNESGNNSIERSIPKDNKKKFNKITNISKYQNYYTNINNINNNNNLIHKNTTTENLLSNMNNSSIKIDDFSNQTYQFSSATNIAKNNNISMKPILSEISSLNNKNKQIINSMMQNSSNIDNSSKYNTHNEEINYSLGNSKNLAIADETDDSNRKTFSKRKITSMQFHNFSSLDTGPENKSIKMNDMTKYSFITKNNSRTFMASNNKNEGSKNMHLNNIKPVWKLNTIGNDDDTYNSEVVNDNKGVRINSYIINRKKPNYIPKS